MTILLSFCTRAAMSIRAIVLVSCIWQFTKTIVLIHIQLLIKDIHREKAPSNETPAFTKSTNMDIWIVGTTNQLFIRGS